MRGHSFDTNGFFFILKAIAVITVLVFGAYTIGGHIAHINSEVAASGTQEQEIEKEKTEPTTQKPRTIVLSTIADQVPDNGKFIGVDLEKMELYTYEDGELLETFEVHSKGKPGSRWETPTGSYTIGYKNPRHFSSIGEVYMPSSMQFFGNFFIHGWPEYENGTPVPEGYSGGCIRLSTENAERIFNFAELQTPVFVYDPDAPENTDTELKIHTSPPLVSATGYLVANLHTNEVYAEKNADVNRPIASISKLMTAVVANETIGYNKFVYVSNAAVTTYGEQGGLYEGQRMSLHTMLHPLLLESSNDAAEAIAGHLGTTYFYDLMNRKATALGMNNSHFSDASGLSDANTSSPADLFKLAHYIYTKKKYIFDLTTLPSATLLIEGTGLRQSFYNNNPFRDHPDYAGGKNGYTDAARKTLLTVFETTLGEKTYPVVIIVLGSEDHTQDTRSLYSWLQTNVR